MIVATGRDGARRRKKVIECSTQNLRRAASMLAPPGAQEIIRARFLTRTIRIEFFLLLAVGGDARALGPASPPFDGRLRTRGMHQPRQRARPEQEHFAQLGLWATRRRRSKKDGGSIRKFPQQKVLGRKPFGQMVAIGTGKFPEHSGPPETWNRSAAYGPRNSGRTGVGPVSAGGTWGATRRAARQLLGPKGLSGEVVRKMLPAAAQIPGRSRNKPQGRALLVGLYATASISSGNWTGPQDVGEGAWRQTAFDPAARFTGRPLQAGSGAVCMAAAIVWRLYGANPSVGPKNAPDRIWASSGPIRGSAKFGPPIVSFGFGSVSVLDLPYPPRLHFGWGIMQQETWAAAPKLSQQDVSESSCGNDLGDSPGSRDLQG